MSYETLINLPDSLVIVKYYDGQRFITSFQKRYVLKQHVFDIRLPFYSGHVFPRIRLVSLSLGNAARAEAARARQNVSQVF